MAIAALDGRLTKTGAPELEDTGKVGEMSMSGPLFGARKINDNYDVVDEINPSAGAAATVFVKEGDDFVRVSIKLLTPEGQRGVGTALARAKAYEALSKGDWFCGVVDVLGTSPDSCYNPVKDGGGKVIGVTCVGYKQSRARPCCRVC